MKKYALVVAAFVAMTLSALATGHRDIRASTDVLEEIPSMVRESPKPDECPNMLEFFNVINGAPDSERAIEIFQLYAAFYEPARVMSVADVHDAQAEIATNGLDAWKDEILPGIVDELQFNRCITFVN